MTYEQGDHVRLLERAIHHDELVHVVLRHPSYNLLVSLVCWPGIGHFYNDVVRVNEAPTCLRCLRDPRDL